MKKKVKKRKIKRSERVPVITIDDIQIWTVFKESGPQPIFIQQGNSMITIPIDKMLHKFLGAIRMLLKLHKAEPNDYLESANDKSDELEIKYMEMR